MMPFDFSSSTLSNYSGSAQPMSSGDKCYHKLCTNLEFYKFMAYIIGYSDSCSIKPDDQFSMGVRFRDEKTIRKEEQDVQLVSFGVVVLYCKYFNIHIHIHIEKRIEKKTKKKLSYSPFRKLTHATTSIVSCVLFLMLYR